MSSGSGTSWGFGLGLGSRPGRSSRGSWSAPRLNWASPQREGPTLGSPPSGGSRAISRIFAHHNCAVFTYLLEFESYSAEARLAFKQGGREFDPLRPYSNTNP